MSAESHFPEPPDGIAITAEPPLDEEEVPLALLSADAVAAIAELRAAAQRPPAPPLEATHAPSSERACTAVSIGMVNTSLCMYNGNHATHKPLPRS
jgi:hypothetical protein